MSSLSCLLRLLSLAALLGLAGCATLAVPPAPSSVAEQAPPAAVQTQAAPPAATHRARTAESPAAGSTPTGASPATQALPADLLIGEAGLRPPRSQQAALVPPPGAALPVKVIAPDLPAFTLDLTAPAADLWERLRRGFSMPNLHHPLVADRQSWYLNRPEALRRIFERGGRYLHHIVEELEKRGMPTELALLPMVESAYNPQAVSPARAMGMWQFIPSTGKNYDLQQDWWADERRDIVASTEAALNYLSAIYEMHGDWHLALASYNWGEHAVARAIVKNRGKGLPTDYASLNMPAETRYYVPKLQALKNIVAHPEYFDFRMPPLANQAYFESVSKPERIDVAIAAKLAEMSIEDFVALNPAYHRPVIQGDRAGPILLPADKIETFLDNLAQHEAEDKPLSNWLTYTMKKGDSLAKIAASYRIGETRLRQINGITSRVRVGPGFALLVPRPGSGVNPEAVANLLPREAPAKMAVAKKGKAKKAASSSPRPKAKPAAAKKKSPPKK